MRSRSRGTGLERELAALLNRRIETVGMLVEHDTTETPN
jgi:hypothetical protein